MITNFTLLNVFIYTTHKKVAQRFRSQAIKSNIPLQEMGGKLIVSLSGHTFGK